MFPALLIVPDLFYQTTFPLSFPFCLRMIIVLQCVYSLEMRRFSNEPVCLEVTFFYLFLIALIKYIRPVFVSRSDQNSRKKTVEEIKRRAHSGAEWPQVKL